MSPDGVADRRPVGLRHVDGQVAGLPLLQRDGPGAHVEERVDAHHGAPRGSSCEPGWRAQVVDPVGQHHALGPAGAAGGEENDVGVSLVRRVFDLAGRLRAASASRSASVTTGRSCARAHLVAAARVVGVDDEQRRLRDRRNRMRLLGARARRQRAVHRTHPCQGGEERDRVQAWCRSSTAPDRRAAVPRACSALSDADRPAGRSRPKVRTSSPSAAAGRCGTARAALRKTVPMVRPVTSRLLQAGSFELVSFKLESFKTPILCTAAC